MKNILIIEDNNTHMENLCSLLEENFRVNIFKAYNVEEACYMLSFNCIHLFLVDIILNPVDNPGNVMGLELVKKIRENKSYVHTPVIFLTSLEDPSLYAYRQLHCYSYLEKPYNPEELIKLVEEALEFPVKEETKDIY